MLINVAATNYPPCYVDPQEVCAIVQLGPSMVQYNPATGIPCLNEPMYTLDHVVVSVRMGKAVERFQIKGQTAEAVKQIVDEALGDKEVLVEALETAATVAEEAQDTEKAWKYRSRVERIKEG